MKKETENLPDVIALAVQTIQERSRDLGISWALRMATVIKIATAEVTAVFDGDSVQIPMVSMIGTLFPGERVYVLMVPPSGNFITGRVAAQETGDESISFTTQTSFTRTVRFVNPFINIPRVFTNINSGAGSTAGWGSRAFNVTRSSFTLFVFGSSSTWASVHVYWAAFAE